MWTTGVLLVLTHCHIVTAIFRETVTFGLAFSAADRAAPKLITVASSCKSSQVHEKQTLGDPAWKTYKKHQKTMDNHPFLMGKSGKSTISMVYN